MQKSPSWFFYLCAVEGAVTIAVLLSISSEGGSLSLARLALIGFVFLISVAWAVLGIRGWGGGKQVYRYTDKHVIYVPVYLFTSVLVSLFLLRYLDPPRLFSIYQRLSPLLWYLLVLSIQVFFFLLISNHGFHPENLSSRKPIYLSALAAFCLLLLVFLLVSLTRLGLTPDSAYWGEPGAPILGWGFALALIGGLFLFWLTNFARPRGLDLLLPLAIYLIAVVTWLSVPTDVLKNSFYMPMNAPTFQAFPYSDAGYYDQMAHSLLVGHPYQGEIPARPLYIFLLTILHIFFGEDYRLILIGQTFLLGLIPVLFYYLGKKLHSRVAGVIIALFFIFRELTSLLISSETRVSNTKTILVDLPTLLLLIFACLFTLRWLEQKDKKNAFVAGGMLGLLLLLRTQSVLVLPFIILAAFFVLNWKTKLFYQLTSLFLLGLLITIAPWLIHNYLETGEFTFDAKFQYASIASQYAYTGNLDIRNFDFEGKGLGQVLLEFALKDPAFVFGFISNHFLAAQVHGLLALPLFKPYNGIFEPINLYWMDWNGQLEWYNVVLIILYLAIIAVGFGSAWKRWRWLGLLPLAFSIGYSLATAVGRFSGWRYDLPADWVWYFYFGIGFAELLHHAALLFTSNPRAERREDVFSVRTETKRTFQEIFCLAILFAFLGSLPWLIKNIASPRYPDQSPKVLVEKIASISDAPAMDEIASFANQPDSFLQVGRLLYPRFFSRNNGLSSTNPWPAYAERDFPRMGFLLLNQTTNSAIFRTRQNADVFPHASDAIILGCQRDDYVDVRLVAFPALDAIQVSAPLTESCSSLRP